MSKVEWPSSAMVRDWLYEVERKVGLDGEAQNALRRDVLEIVKADHLRKMLSGITRYGQPRAPLAPSTLANKKRGPGPSLIPRLRSSRYITKFLATWEWQGMTGGWTGGRSVLSMRFLGFVSKKGFPIPLAHEKGARRGNWVLPARPVMGLSPKGLREVDARFRQFKNEVIRHR